MPASDAKATVDSISPATATGGWICSTCVLEITKEEEFCKVCFFARPMSRNGVPQIFTGLVIHFNGIIPRTTKHPSHSVEWRMAERHGATCMTQLEMGKVNVLVYRPGYERSEKVKKCVELMQGIFVVPIAWMLDSLLQSRQIHPSLYQLTSIPLVPQPTVKGLDLPHHHHPYYLMNVKEYSLSPLPVLERNANGAPGAARYVIAAGDNVRLPPSCEVPELRYTNMSVCEAVCNAVAKKEAEKKEDVDEISDDMREAPSEVVDMVLFKGDLHNNRVNSALFSGIKFLLSPSLESNAAVVRALGVCGGKVVVSPHEKLGDVLRSSVTHVLYDQSEKKCALLIEAASVKKTVPGLVLAQFNWAEDCMMLKELIPPYGPYAPSAKLLDTLEKKHRKRSEL